MPPGRAAAPSPASSAPRLGARPAAPSPPASDASRPTSLHPELPFPARALPQGPGMLHFTPDSAQTFGLSPRNAKNLIFSAGSTSMFPSSQMLMDVVYLAATLWAMAEAG